MKKKTWFSPYHDEPCMLPTTFWQFWSGTITKTRNNLRICSGYHNAIWSSTLAPLTSTRKCTRTTKNWWKKAKSMALSIILLTWQTIPISSCIRSRNCLTFWELLLFLTTKGMMSIKTWLCKSFPSTRFPARTKSSYWKLMTNFPIELRTVTKDGSAGTSNFTLFLPKTTLTWMSDLNCFIFQLSLRYFLPWLRTRM